MPVAKLLIGFRWEIRKERSLQLINKQNLSSQMSKVVLIESVVLKQHLIGNHQEMSVIIPG